MAERKAVNKYYPPDWTPSKGSINKHVGQHPLRDRAKKIKQGILVIRFEMPYNIWCGGCEAHIGMGVRYNAEKSRNGNYYSTPIWKFRMKCHLCDNYFEMQTDPQNHDYVILSGARRKEQRWDPTENGQIQTEDKATQKKMATDAMYKLEHGNDDQNKGKKAVMTLHQLEDRKESYKEDYLLNKLARNKFREEKQVIKEKKDADKALLDKSSLDIELVEENEEDRKIAGLMKYSVIESYEEKQKERRKNIYNQPVFDQSSTVSPANKLLALKQKYDPFNTTNKTKTVPKIDLGIRLKGKQASKNSPSRSTRLSSDLKDVKTNIDLTDSSLLDSSVSSSVPTSIPCSESIAQHNSNNDNNTVICDISKVSNDTSLIGLSTLMASYSDSDCDN